MIKNLLPIFAIITLISCTSVHGNHVSSNKEGWFNGVRKGDFIVSPNFLSALNPFLDRGFYYCKANEIEGTTLANPICYKVNFSSYSDQKSVYDREKDYEAKSEVKSEVKLKEKK